MRSLFERLNDLCEGALAVDAQARIVWINEKYVATLGLRSAREALGREVEEVIPNSLMREVVRTGQPILLDIMQFGEQSLVVTRMPLQDEGGKVIGAIGFVLYDRLHYLKPLVAKFAKLQMELADAQRKLVENRRPRYTLSSFVGSSAACLEVKRQARRAAQQDTTVLLQGETGTGKEMLAHAIHAASDRARYPFIALNVAAIPDNLLEAEFFGSAPGAYTGADSKGRDGKFKIADGGTLFLDEIGDMPLALQTKLLRVLQDQEVEPLGSNKVFKVDVRIIAATSVDLKQLVKEGRFRSDLYYRLNVLPIAVPPLRARLSDLEVLCESALEQIAARTGSPQREVTPSAIAALALHDWPGNVRELRNVLEQATMLTDNLRLTAEDFASILPASQGRTASAEAPVRRYADALAEFERNTFRSALDACGGKVSAAAQMLGMSRASLYKRLASLGLQSHG
ncbi:MAG TPA: sigma 54-interacting transcriptional regulator [Casimicrobiaceae bacterium]|nr:sigma 54-interacting transcriptional regulator [Casimicrobiaceae bacterium]